MVFKDTAMEQWIGEHIFPIADDRVRPIAEAAAEAAGGIRNVTYADMITGTLYLLMTLTKLSPHRLPELCNPELTAMLASAAHSSRNGLAVMLHLDNALSSSLSAANERIAALWLLLCSACDDVAKTASPTTN